MAGAFDAINAGARIVNFSWGSRIPATLSFAAIPFSGFTAAYRALGILFFSSAGNTPPGKSPEDVDEEDCFLVCWEAAFHMPCENAGMVCVGGLNLNGDTREAGSSYGYQSCGGLCDVDIFGPFWTYVTPDPVNVPGGNQARLAAGTSYASPFVAGVAALVWAANPALDAGDVENVLYTNANPSPDVGTQRYVNALAAVRAVFGGNVPPNVQITRPAHGGIFPYNTQVELSAQTQDYEDPGCCIVSWSSDLDGPLGTTHGNTTGFVVSFPTPAVRRVHATVTDRAGASATTSVLVAAYNAPPTVTAEAPSASGPLYRDAAYRFRARVSDANLDVGCGAVAWTSNDPSDHLAATGCDPFITFNSAGMRTVTASATDPYGEKASSSVTVTVISPPPNSPPVATINSPADGSFRYFYYDIALRGQARDADHDAISYRWTVRCRAGGPEVQIATGAEATWRPTREDAWRRGCQVSDIIVTLYASDKDGTGSDAVTVEMREPIP